MLAMFTWWLRRKEPRPLPGLFRPVVIVVGVFEGLEVIAYHASIPPLGVGIATVLSNLQVVLVGLAGVFLFHEQPKPWFWASIPLTLAGV